MYSLGLFQDTSCEYHPQNRYNPCVQLCIRDQGIKLQPSQLWFFWDSSHFLKKKQDSTKVTRKDTVKFSMWTVKDKVPVYPPILCYLSLSSCYWCFFLHISQSLRVSYFAVRVTQFTLVLALAWVAFSTYQVKEVSFRKGTSFPIKNLKKRMLIKC